MSKGAFLLDTQVFLWAGMNVDALSKRAHKLLNSSDSELFLSVASIWEIAIKKSLGKLKLPVPTTTFVNSVLDAGGIALLSIEPAHAIGVEEVERIHGDPFDRLLVSQTRHEGLELISSDEIFDSYKVKRVW